MLRGPGPVGAGIDRLFPLWVAVSIGLPAALGGLITWSWWGALTALFLGQPGVDLPSAPRDLVDQLDLPHMIGDRPFASRDKAANFWPLAILSMGESWHNSHHADPTRARHGVLRGQINISARLIWIFDNSVGCPVCAGPTPRGWPASPARR